MTGAPEPPPDNDAVPAAPPEPTPAEDAAAARARAALGEVRDMIAAAVVGHAGAVSGLLTALLVRGHVLLEGVPGTAKTLMVKSVSRALHLDSARVQFTPDLMPSDVTGQLVYDQRTASFTFRQGPVFTNLLLADEVNRTPAKTQAALLQAMEERHVTVEGADRALPTPFMVIATQNPIEQEGTYPLPEAQVDRFLFKLTLGYPDEDAEVAIVDRHDRGLDPHDLAAAGVEPVADADDLAAARAALTRLRVDPAVQHYVVQLCRATRDAPSVELGVSPRGATMLLHAAKAWAWLSGRDFVTPDEVKAVARPTLRHRLLLRPEAELEGATADGVLDGLLAAVPTPR